MPTPPIISLDLDITGINPDNFIDSEPHTLSNRPSRSIAPIYGPFFAASVQVRDGATLLQRGVHYQCVELHQEATLLYGKEICSIILIIDQNVSTNVEIAYQALGGHYTYSGSNESLVNMYNSVINDNRPVDWMNVLNKPSEFNPTIHRHLLDDVYGFEPIVDYLERIKRAITLGQTDVVLGIINSLLTKFECGKELPKVLPSTKIMQYDSLLYFLSKRKMLSDTWIDKKDCTWYKGDSAVIQIDTSAYPVGTDLYWYMYRPEGSIALFSTTSGVVKSNGGIAEVYVYVPSEAYVNNDPLYLGIKEDPNAEEFKAVSYTINVDEYVTTDSYYGYLYSSNSQPNDRETFIGSFADSNEVRLYYMLRYA